MINASIASFLLFFFSIGKKTGKDCYMLTIFKSKGLRLSAALSTVRPAQKHSFQAPTTSAALLHTRVMSSRPWEGPFCLLQDILCTHKGSEQRRRTAPCIFLMLAQKALESTWHSRGRVPRSVLSTNLGYRTISE